MERGRITLNCRLKVERAGTPYADSCHSSSPRASAASRRRPGSPVSHAPPIGIARVLELCRGADGELRNDACPEWKCTWAALGNTNDPPARKTVPQQHGRPPAHAGATVTTNHKELGDIEDARVVRRRRTTSGRTMFRLGGALLPARRPAAAPQARRFASCSSRNAHNLFTVGFSLSADR
jgi:hypothetical protein